MTDLKRIDLPTRHGSSRGARAGAAPDRGIPAAPGRRHHSVADAVPHDWRHSRERV